MRITGRQLTGPDRGRHVRSFEETIVETQYAFETEAELLGALASPIRLQVLVLLLEHEWSVMDLADKIGVRQSALSRHLQQLRDLKIVNTRRDANFIFYSCDHSLVRAVLRVLNLVAE